MGEIRAESWNRKSPRPWNTIKDRIAELEHECCGQDAFSPSELRLYADVRAAGARYIERDAAIANGYADKIVCFHAADVFETCDHDSPYGPQRFIRMRVPGT